MSSHLHVPAILPGVRAPAIHWIGGWVSPRPSPDAVTKRKNHIIASTRN